MIRNARPEEYGAILDLLKENCLPLDGFPGDSPIILATGEGEAVEGCAALEIHGDWALLRSVAVNARSRNLGLGSGLINAAIAEAVRCKMKGMYLLTETAVDYFPRFGFQITDRSAVPAVLRSSVEFTSACPDSAIAMFLLLRQDSPTVSTE